MPLDYFDQQRIKAADSIIAVEPSGKPHHLWGQDTVPACSGPGSAARRLDFMEIPVSSKHELLQLMDEVIRIRGRLPHSQQEAYKQLQQGPDGQFT